MTLLEGGQIAMYVTTLFGSPPPSQPSLDRSYKSGIDRDDLELISLSKEST